LEKFLQGIFKILIVFIICTLFLAVRHIEITSGDGLILSDFQKLEKAFDILRNIHSPL